MFDKKRVQVNMLKSMFNPKCKMRKCDLGDTVLISINGVTVYCFDKSDIMIDLDKVTDADQLGEIFDTKDLIRLNDTGMRKQGYTNSIMRKQGYTNIIAKLSSDDESLAVYVDQKYINQFSACVFYGTSPKSPVFVKDAIGNVVGMIMPLFMHEKF